MSPIADNTTDIPDYEDENAELNLTRATITVEVLVNNQPTELSVMSIKFEEAVFEHSVLSVTLAPDPDGGNTSRDLTAQYLDMIGKSIVVKFEATDSYAVTGAEKRQFQGTIFDVSFEFQSTYECKITLHGISNTFRLDQAVRNEVFVKTRRSDIADKFIKEADLNPELKRSTVQEDYVYCHNETRWSFLKRYARSEGLWLYSEGDKVLISSALATDSATLTWGKDMGSLHARIHTQGFNTIVRSWDYKKKEAIVAKSSSSTELSSAAKNASKVAKETKLFRDESYIDIRMTGTVPVDSFKTAANAAAEGAKSGLARCNGQTNVPGLRVGFTVKIEGSGAAWNSQYFVTKVTHVIEEGSYYNFFESLPLDIAHPEWQNPNPPISDFIVGIVTNLDDPDKLGRVKVKFPTLDSAGSELESDWARISSLYAGNERGIFFLPEVGDEVLVCFERGDINHPIVVGCLWNGKDQPSMADASNSAAENDIKTIYTRSGHQITFCDKSGGESIKIIDSSEGNFIIINTSEQKISIVSDKDIAIEAGKDITLTAKGDIKLEGANISMSAKQKFGVEGGSQVDVKSNGMMSLEASATGKLKGAMLDLDGGSMCNVKGAMIKLN